MEDVVVRRRFGRRRALDSQELVVQTVAEHAESLLRVARWHSSCQADAEDTPTSARWRSSSGRRTGSIRRTVHNWLLHVVVKREAWAVAEQRSRLVGVEAELDVLDDGRCTVSVKERTERFEGLERAAEALKRLKPQEVTALVLRAQGLSYQEIAERNSWTYTKVKLQPDRAVAHGCKRRPPPARNAHFAWLGRLCGARRRASAFA